MSETRFGGMPEMPEGRNLLLLSALYAGDEASVYLKFYDPSDDQIYFWRDRTGHLPYCFTKMEFEQDIKRIIETDMKNFQGQSRYGVQRVKVFDMLEDREIEVYKISAADPLSIGGVPDSLRENMTVWEGDIRYHENYLYDQNLIPGLWYIRQGEKISNVKLPVSEKTVDLLQSLVLDKVTDSNQEYKDYATLWAEMLNQPIPQIRRVAVDIEVESEVGQMPQIKNPIKRVTAVGLVASDGLKKVYVLDRPDSNTGQPFVPEAVICKSERELLVKVFNILKDYPVVITFNGDAFDLPYLHARAMHKDIGIERSDIPLTVRAKFDNDDDDNDESKRKTNINFVEPVNLKHGLHIDLFRFYQNKSIQNYAYSQKYKEFTLDAICQGIMGEAKMEVEFEDFSDAPMQELAAYCLRDAELTCKLTTYQSNLLMKLLVVIARVARLPVDDVSRIGVNQWIRGMLYYEHRRRNALIPRYDELADKGAATTAAIIKEKKYRGGYVKEPESGAFFNVTVLDFASLYPSVVNIHNLSYETVNCGHPACKQDVRQFVHGTAHWICKQKRGLTSLLIGSLRDLRVNYYKHLSKDKSLPVDEKELYNVIAQALKVILNGSYGVMGFEQFPLYCLPVADGVTALGRNKTIRTIAKAGELQTPVIASDTDSLFLHAPTIEVINELIRWADDVLHVELENDKTYRYVVFSGLKKNYFGVYPDGKTDIKGLTGKKSNTPPFIRNAFKEILAALGAVMNESEFPTAKAKIKTIVNTVNADLRSFKIPVADLAFTMALNKSPDKYTKTVPQHVRAAKMLIEKGYAVKSGDRIAFIKARKKQVIPVKLADARSIDLEIYTETMGKVFEQVLGVLEVDMDTMLGIEKQVSLDKVFWS
jgi:DNA polymerase I